MSETRSRLPDFTNPPVIEVALSVQFEPLSGFRTSHFGLLWSDFRRQFPRTEEHPPRPPVIDQFGIRRAPKMDVRVEMALPVPQCRFLTVWTTRYSDTFLSGPEDIGLRVRYIIPGVDGSPIGRLLVSVDPAYRAEDDRPIYVLLLTARGRPIGQGIEGALGFLDIGREWIVRGFTSLTSPRMHEIWGRRNAH